LNLLPHEWWDLIKVSGCTLAPIAHHIFMQVAYTSSCKRNWNAYSFVHNKMWYRLMLKWVGDLLYIYINIKIMWEQFNVNPTTWYWKNILFESENTIKRIRGAKVKVFYQGLHMTCVIFVLVYNFKFCISNTPFNIAFKYKYILTTN
jgi:hypothetical protein